MGFSPGSIFGRCLIHRYQKKVVVETADHIRTQKTARVCTRCGHWHARDIDLAREFYRQALEFGIKASAASFIKGETIISNENTAARSTVSAHQEGLLGSIHDANQEPDGL